MLSLLSKFTQNPTIYNINCCYLNVSYQHLLCLTRGLPQWLSHKETACNAGDTEDIC